MSTAAAEIDPVRRWLRQVWIFAPDAGPEQRFVASALCALFALAALAAKLAAAPLTLWLCVVLSYVCGGLRATSEALVAVRARQPDINFLMIVAAVVSALLGHWDDGAILLFLFSLSDALERYAIERTRRSIHGLMKLRPDSARVVRDEREFTVPVEELQIGDIVRARPGERFPVDGVVVDGAGAVDESIVTGEALPIDKVVGSIIFAGTINANGALLVRTSKPATASTIARIVALVEDAQVHKAATQRTIERWQTRYVLGVLAISAATILGYLLATGNPGDALRTGMVMLVAASPCAIVLASPVAVLAAVTRGARQGVLFKGGSYLERLARIDTVAFDKTGTVTFGRPIVTSVHALDGYAEDDVLATAAALERLSEHPLAAAVVREAVRRRLPLAEVRDFASSPGLGVRGAVAGRWVGVGRADFFEQQGRELPPPLLREHANPRNGKTVVFVQRDDGLAGAIQLSDELRPDARDAVAALRRMGIAHLVMLTGDQPEPAARVAEAVGIDDVRAALQPADKLLEIQRLAKTNSGVAMVGDGVNDAPALAAATVGIAMGAAGSDVALETADIVLMRDDLRALAGAIDLARRTQRTILQSLAFAGGMIAVLILLTLTGLLTLPLAVICHEGSTVLVVLNGLRLLRPAPSTP
ncbi:MAG: heavy metal translocating P-type ATPase [Phycisphaerae bacterium]